MPKRPPVDEQEAKANPRTLPSGWRRVRLGDVIAEAKPGFASGMRDAKGVVQLRMNNVDTRGKMVWSEFIRVPDPLQIPAPPYADQQRVAAMLNEQMAAADRARKAIAEELDTINELPAGLLRRAFNGGL
jgi:hypothetical protein